MFSKNRGELQKGYFSADQTVLATCVRLLECKNLSWERAGCWCKKPPAGSRRQAALDIERRLALHSSFLLACSAKPGGIPHWRCVRVLNMNSKTYVVVFTGVFVVFVCIVWYVLALFGICCHVLACSCIHWHWMPENVPGRLLRRALNACCHCA